MSGAKILYIDDDPGLRRLTASALERRGHQVTLAASGIEGIELAGAQAFDLVAVDYFMPGCDGLETLAGLARLEPPPPVIFVTGSDEISLAVAALKAGAIDYVLKSVGMDYFDLLCESVEQALATVAMRQANAAMQDELRQSNERLQSMLHEANHRVANSLQLVSALVSLQARQVRDAEARAALDVTCQRIGAIADIHRRLYSSAHMRAVEMEEYLGGLVAELAQTWSTPTAARAVTLEADPLLLRTEFAVAMGIAVNELVTNACKYAYPGDSAGDISVSLRQESEGEVRLVVADRGRGMDSVSGPRGTGLGGKLVEAMAATLNASVDYADNAPGLRVTLTCKVPVGAP